jgi:hypothetical protein
MSVGRVSREIIKSQKKDVIVCALIETRSSGEVGLGGKDGGFAAARV